MAEIVLTHKFQKVTLTGTDEHTLNFNNVIDDKPGQIVLNGIANIEMTTGTSVQCSPNAAIDADAGLITTAAPRVQIDIRRGTPIRLKGGAGSEVLQVSILSD